MCKALIELSKALLASLFYVKFWYFVHEFFAFIFFLKNIALKYHIFGFLRCFLFWCPLKFCGQCKHVTCLTLVSTLLVSIYFSNTFGFLSWSEPNKFLDNKKRYWTSYWLWGISHSLRLIRNQIAYKILETAFEYHFVHVTKGGAQRGKQPSIKTSWDVRNLKSVRKQTQSGIII